MLQHQHRVGELREVGSFDLVETIVTTMEFVKGIGNLDPAEEKNEKALIDSDAVWIGTNTKKIFIYTASNPEQEKQIACFNVSAPVTKILFHLDSVFVALLNGSIQIFRRSYDGHWLLKEPQMVSISMTDSIESIISINANVYVGCGQKIWVLNGYSGEIQNTCDVHNGHLNGVSHSVNFMAHSGIGLWVSLKNTSVICLYHTETFKHLQDINIAKNVLRVTSSQRECANKNSSVSVTALMACKGLLWVGTNIGIALTIPLPRLEGVPIITGGVNISYHAHFGPVTFLLPLIQKSYYKSSPSEAIQTTTIQQKNFDESEGTKNSDEEVNNDEDSYESQDVSMQQNQQEKREKQISLDIPTKLKIQLMHSPVVLRRRRGKDTMESRMSKTLPRGLGSTAAFTTSMHSNTSSDHSGCDVYGLYGDLIFVKEDFEAEQSESSLLDPSYETLRRSDPELAAIPAKVSIIISML